MAPTKAFNDRVADWVKGKLSLREQERLLKLENLEDIRTALLDLESRTLVHQTNAKKRAAEARTAGDFEEAADQLHRLAGIKAFRGSLYSHLRDVNRTLVAVRQEGEVRGLRKLVDWLVSLDTTVAELEDDCPEELKELLEDAFHRLSRRQRRDCA